MATINDISSLKIKGANFQDKTILELFKKKISLIYGENGAGKSTIARGIYNWANQDDTKTSQFLRMQGAKPKDLLTR